MASGLARHALAQKVDKSRLIRHLLRIGAAAEGVNLTTI